MNWLKNVIKDALKEFLKENDSELLGRSTEHVVLSRENLNVLTIDCGQMPSGKAREYLITLAEHIKKTDPDYKILWIAKRG